MSKQDFLKKIEKILDEHTEDCHTGFLDNLAREQLREKLQCLIEETNLFKN